MRYFYYGLAFTVCASCFTVIVLFLYSCLQQTRQFIVVLANTRMPMIIAITAISTEFSLHHVTIHPFFLFLSSTESLR